MRTTTRRAAVLVAAGALGLGGVAVTAPASCEKDELACAAVGVLVASTLLAITPIYASSMSAGPDGHRTTSPIRAPATSTPPRAVRISKIRPSCG